MKTNSPSIGCTKEQKGTKKLAIAGNQLRICVEKKIIGKDGDAAVVKGTPRSYT